MLLEISSGWYLEFEFIRARHIYVLRKRFSNTTAAVCDLAARFTPNCGRVETPEIARMLCMRLTRKRCTGNLADIWMNSIINRVTEREITIRCGRG